MDIDNEPLDQDQFQPGPDAEYQGVKARQIATVQDRA